MLHKLVFLRLRVFSKVSSMRAKWITQEPNHTISTSSHRGRTRDLLLRLLYVVRLAMCLYFASRTMHHRVGSNMCVHPLDIIQRQYSIPKSVPRGTSWFSAIPSGMPTHEFPCVKNQNWFRSCYLIDFVLHKLVFLRLCVFSKVSSMRAKWITQGPNHAISTSSHRGRTS